MSRYFNYLENNLEFNDAYYICKKIIKDILTFDINLLNDEDKKIVLKIQKDAKGLNSIFSSSVYDISSNINKELLEPENVEYAFKHKKYPLNASKTGDKINEIFNQIFEMEDKMQIINAKLWNKIITPFGKIKNGEKFIVIGHSGSGYIITPQSKYYTSNQYHNTSSYSCSIFTPNSMNYFNSNLVMIFDVDTENFISAAHFDSATTIHNYKSVKTLKIIDQDNIISAGYTNTQDESRIVTKSESPMSVLSKIAKKNHRINEVVLDKEKSNAVGLLLFSKGYDFLFYEYINAKKMEQEYNLELKVINQSLYMNIPISLNEVNDNLLNYEDYILNLNLKHDFIISLLDGYINEVIIPLKLNKEIEKIQIEFINDLKEKIKKHQY